MGDFQMAETKLMNRWLVVVGAVMIQLCLGAIYAWSVFTPPLKTAGWTNAQTQMVFSAGLALFAIVMVLAGRMLPKVGPRKLAVAGGIVLGLGYILGGLLGGTNFGAIFFFVGIVGGSGIGLAYVIPIAVGIKWFPDKKGLITGLAVAGFGFGALLWVKLASNWAELISNFGLSNTFVIYGVTFLVLVLIGAVWMVFPPEGYKPAGWVPAEATVGQPATAAYNFKSGEMLRTRQFYMIFMTFVCGASAGLMSIGLMKLFPMAHLQDHGVDTAAASAIASTAMGVFYALANGVGRIAWGAISDKLGRKPSLIIMTATQGLIVIAFQWMSGYPYLLYLGATLIGFNFGGNFALFPTITADTFGIKHVGQNYGWVFLAYGIGGIFGPLLGGYLGDMKNFPLAFTICGILCLFAAVVIAFVRKPTQKIAGAEQIAA